MGNGPGVGRGHPEGLLRLAALLGVVGSIAGCVSAQPRFPPDVQAAIAHADMRRMETDELIVYYEEGASEEAKRVAARLETCKRELKHVAHVKDGQAATKSIFVLPRLPFNNAYVDPMFLGREQIAVLPEYNTAAYFTPFNLPPDPAAIGCHEMAHDVATRQVRGIAGAVRTVFGNAYTPQIGLDAWWQEGMAVFYETRIQGTGRLDNKYFEGLFAAGVAGKDLNGGYLHSGYREPLHGAHYLIGAHFVDYLVRTYGEDVIWRVIDAQADEFGFPFGVNGRFKTATGKSLSTLIDDFSGHVKARFPARSRRPEQVVVRPLHRDSTLAVSRGGRMAIITAGLDQRLLLEVRDPDGRVLVSRLLHDIGAGRRLIGTSPFAVSGASFTADGKHLYFVALDAGELYSVQRLLHLDVEADALEVLKRDLGGAGGSVDAVGTRYYFTRPQGDSYATYVLDLKRDHAYPLTGHQPKRFEVEPMVSPDGSRLLVQSVGAGGVRLSLYDALRGIRLGSLPSPPGMTFHGSWVDDRRVVYVASDGERMQVFETDLETGVYRRLTDVPYLVTKPFSDGRVLRFLNREGWSWTLDRAPHPPREATSSPEAAPWTAMPPPSALSAARLQYRGYADRPVNVHSDEAYSSFERLFVPQAWAPYYVQREESDVALGAAVNGGDRLGHHLWMIGAAYDFRAELPSVFGSYLNATLAPWTFRLDAAFVGRRETTGGGLPSLPGQPLLIRETVGSAAISRTWYRTNTAGAGARYIDADYRSGPSGPTLEQQRFAGPLAFFRHESYDATPYGGKRFGLQLEGMGTYFPRQLAEADFDIVDALGELEVVLPLPLSARHKLTLTGTGRSLFGVPALHPILEVGGGGTAIVPMAGSGAQEESGGGVLPPGLRFIVPLRGYESLSLFGRRTAVGQLQYSYPFIFDWGTASSLGIFPAFLLRQIDLELFFTAASMLEPGRETAMAAGAALAFRFTFWRLPLTFRVQEARRLTYDEKFATFLSLGPDL